MQTRQSDRRTWMSWRKKFPTRQRENPRRKGAYLALSSRRNGVSAGKSLHRRLLCGRRQHRIQAKIVGVLTVVVRPIARGHHDDTCARHFAAAEEGKSLPEIGIIERCQRLVAEGEGFFKSGNQRFLGVRPGD